MKYLLIGMLIGILIIRMKDYYFNKKPIELNIDIEEQDVDIKDYENIDSKMIIYMLRELRRIKHKDYFKESSNEATLIAELIDHEMIFLANKLEEYK